MRQFPTSHPSVELPSNVTNPCVDLRLAGSPAPVLGGKAQGQELAAPGYSGSIRGKDDDSESASVVLPHPLGRIQDRESSGGPGGGPIPTEHSREPRSRFG